MDKQKTCAALVWDSDLFWNNTANPLQRVDITLNEMLNQM